MNNKNQAMLFLFLLFFLILKTPAISLPLHWDELLYASTSFYLSNGPFYPGKYFDSDVIRFQGNPPLYYHLLAIAYALFGYTLKTTRLISVLSALAALAYTFKMGKRLGGFNTGFLAAVFLASSPLFFAQSGLAHADILLTALSASTVYHYLAGDRKTYLASAALLALTKPQGLFIAAAIVGHEIFVKKKGVKTCIRDGFFTPFIIFIAWILLFRTFAGMYFSQNYMWRIDHPELFMDFGLYKTILLNTFIEQYDVILTAAIALHIIRNRQTEVKPGSELFFLLMLTLTCTLGMLVTYPTWLPRYTLFVKPAFYVIGAASLASLLKRDYTRYLASTAILLLYVSSWHTPHKTEGGSVLEKNMDYADLVDCYKQTLDYIAANHPNAVILAANKFPMEIIARYPQAGYVKKPFTTLSLKEGLTALDNGCVRPNISYSGEWGLGGFPGFPQVMRVNESDFIVVSESFASSGWQRLKRGDFATHAYGYIRPMKVVDVNNARIWLYGIDRSDAVLPKDC